MTARQWRACGFVKFHSPEARRYCDHLHMISPWQSTKPEAMSIMRQYAASVISRGWVFWVEPDNMDAEESGRYRPARVREFVK